MMTKEIIFRILMEEFPLLKSNFGVLKVGLFGSYAKNCANDDSDIDLIIEFSEPIGLKFIALNEYLEKLFNKKVDILTPIGLESIRIKSISESILKSIVYVEAA